MTKTSNDSVPDDYHYKTKADLVLEVLREAILAGDIPSGARLLQNEIAKKFSTSTTPVREAFKHLEREGSLLYHPHKGMRVAELSTESIDEIYSLRMVIESMIAGRACERLTKADLAQLRALEDTMEQLVVRVDVRSIAQVNHDFHRLIHIRSGSRLLHEWISRLWLLSPIDTYWTVPKRGLLSVREHQKILAAFIRRDKKAAEEAMRCHVNSTWRTTKKAKIGIKPRSMPEPSVNSNEEQGVYDVVQRESRRRKLA